MTGSEIMGITMLGGTSSPAVAGVDPGSIYVLDYSPEIRMMLTRNLTMLFGAQSFKDTDVSLPDGKKFMQLK